MNSDLVLADPSHVGGWVIRIVLRLVVKAVAHHAVHCAPMLLVLRLGQAAEVLPQLHFAGEVRWPRLSRYRVRDKNNNNNVSVVCARKYSGTTNPQELRNQYSRFPRLINKQEI